MVFYIEVDIPLPYLRCVTLEEGNYIIREIHKGISKNYLGAKALAFKALRQGYYWLTLYGNVDHISCTCHNCQIHSDVSKKPLKPLTVLKIP